MSRSINVRINERDDIVVNPGSNPEWDKKVKIVSLRIWVGASSNKAQLS